MRPNMNTWATGMRRMASISSRFVNAFGLSKGTAEFEL